MEVFTSLLFVFGASLPLFYLTHVLVSKLTSGKIVGGIILASLVVSSLAIWYIDLGLPLSETHLRSTGKALPIHYAVLAWVAKLWFLTCGIVGARALKKMQEKA